MNVQYMTSSELKTRAKNLLEGRFGSAMLIIFLGILITSVLSLIPNSIVTTFLSVLDLPPVAGNLLILLCSTAVSLFTNIFSVGYALFFLNMACGRSCDVGCLFYGFRWQFQKCLTLSGFFSLFTVILVLPFHICSGMFQQTRGTYWMMASMLAAAAALAASTVFSLLFSQCYYLLLDFPDYTVRQLLASSVQIMKGHKGRLFYLQMSFIPLVILVCLTCGIGALWIGPYAQMTYACFFLDLMNPRKMPADAPQESNTPPQAAGYQT